MNLNPVSRHDELTASQNLYHQQSAHAITKLALNSIFYDQPEVVRKILGSTKLSGEMPIRAMCLLSNSNLSSSIMKHSLFQKLLPNCVLAFDYNHSENLSHLFVNGEAIFPYGFYSNKRQTGHQGYLHIKQEESNTCSLTIIDQMTNFHLDTTLNEINVPIARTYKGLNQDDTERLLSTLYPLQNPNHFDENLPEEVSAESYFFSIVNECLKDLQFEYSIHKRAIVENGPCSVTSFYDLLQFMLVERSNFQDQEVEKLKTEFMNFLILGYQEFSKVDQKILSLMQETVSKRIQE